MLGRTGTPAYRGTGHWWVRRWLKTDLIGRQPVQFGGGGRHRTGLWGVSQVGDGGRTPCSVVQMEGAEGSSPRQAPPSSWVSSEVWFGGG